MGGAFSSVTEDLTGTDMTAVIKPIGTTMTQVGELGQIGIVWFSIGVAVWQLLLIAKNLMAAGNYNHLTPLSIIIRHGLLLSRFFSTERFDRQIYTGRWEDKAGVWEHEIND